jgi:hypothetical protein
LKPVVVLGDETPVYAENLILLKKSREQLPQGYFSVGLVLPSSWKPDVLAHELNSLYGGTFREEPFRYDTGARTFTFFGERASEAEALCDALRDSWLHRAEDDHNVIITMVAGTLKEFIETALLIGRAGAEAYYRNWKYHLIAGPDEEALREIRAQIALFAGEMEHGRRGR